VPHLSASAVVIQYEEAVCQVYAPLSFYPLPMKCLDQTDRTVTLKMLKSSWLLYVIIQELMFGKRLFVVCSQKTRLPAQTGGDIDPE